MTQYPNQPAGKSIVNREDLKDEDLKIDMPARTRTKKKSAALKRNVKNLGRCLKYLGIKDRYMMDHFYPEFHAALEKKIEEKIAREEQQEKEVKGGPDVDDANMALVVRGQDKRYKWVAVNEPERATAHRMHSEPAVKRQPFSRKAFLTEHDDQKLRALEEEQQPKRLKICKFEDTQLHAMFKKD